MPILELYTEHCIGQCFRYNSVLFYGILLWHFKRAAKIVIFLLIINLGCITRETTFQTATAHKSVIFSHEQIAIDLL